MRLIERDAPTGGKPPFTRMHFLVADDSSAGVELLWMESVGGNSYRVMNIPGWVSGIALDDIVEGEVRPDGSLDFKRVLAHSGHSTYRLMMQGSPEIEVAFSRIAPLLETGCGLERIGPHSFSVDVPAAVDIWTVYAQLEKGMNDDHYWWFDELFCGHPVSGS